MPRDRRRGSRAVSADAGARGVRIMAASQQLPPYSEPLADLHLRHHAAHIPERSVHELFASARISLSQIDLALIYDATTVAVLLTLEDFGFVSRGGAKDFLASNQHGPGGRDRSTLTPGLLSEGYVHGMNLLIEVSNSSVTQPITK